MTPFTREEADAEARAALLAGDSALIEVATAQLDAFDEPAREQNAARTLGAALWYAQQGLHVFPLQAGSKVPHRGTRGCSDASDDVEQLRSWWARWPDSNVALATGHVVDVIDFDGLIGHISWGEMYGGTWAGVERLAVVSTPRPGGLHIWIAAEGGRNRASKLAPGLDHRGLGGYVVLPPSTITTGPNLGTYRFIHPYSPEGRA